MQFPWQQQNFKIKLKIPNRFPCKLVFFLFFSHMQLNYDTFIIHGDPTRPTHRGDRRPHHFLLPHHPRHVPHGDYDDDCVHGY